ncbi:lipid II flippase MurJ [Thiomicrorhabdus xiamenensis]|uniref:lipid II flippase MurJ n=1 Tax=Thiomicrorhabdus xiamenensis TaxID=2739063 RepID=UPI0030B80D3A
MALAWGVLVAGVVQLLFHLPFLYRLGLLPSPSRESDPGVGEVKRLMLPALFGVSVAQNQPVSRYDSGLFSGHRFGFLAVLF